MQLTSPSVVQKVFREYHIRPKRTLGQNFLIDKNNLEKIIRTANLSKEDIVLEIGSGIGTLTAELCKKARCVYAVEIDKELIPILKNTLKDFSNVEIIQSDALKFVSYFKPAKKYKVVANIPYQITSPLLEKLLTTGDQVSFLESILITVQKEVGQRICAKPPSMNRLAVLVQSFGKPSIISYISASCFWPKPEVDSVVIKINIVPNSSVDPGQFIKLVKKGFSQKRKQLKNVFESQILENAGIMPKMRAEKLGVKDWQKIYNVKYKVNKGL
ncbi:MAG: 16S rRNA (adenine(1518)-N(6)/adenine(1519)-N(6))-dimethyltransferase RsmA [Candidatus Berkelbacteria bacterium]|nr:16S rRNA (adenine(1518)-N(6)/adenine(1519)-N(6))-dimethyltransferase RsmA [Candidatus Berkelbacteria bacterium]